MSTIVIGSLFIIVAVFIIVSTWFNMSLERRCMDKVEEMMEKYKYESKISSAEDLNNLIQELDLKKRSSYLPPSKYDGCLFD